jgi:hypothetical protein
MSINGIDFVCTVCNKPFVIDNAIGQGGAACGASPAPTGCASNGTNNERTEK